MITWENYEEYMMLHADGELTPAEEQALMSFIYEHPELANELAAFSMSKMIPDTTQVYADKKSLLKKEPTRIIAFPHWQRYAVAAGVAVLLGVAGLRFFTSQPARTSGGYVQNDKKEIVVPVQDDKIKSEPKQAVAAIVSPQNIIPAPVHTHNGRSFTAQPAHRAKRSVQDDKKAIAPTAVAVEAIDRLPAEYVGMINNDRKIFSPGAVTNVPTATINIEEEQKKSFLDKLPIDELKKEGMENFATAVASGYDKVKAIRRDISETSISLKIEKRRLVVSF